MDRNISLDLLKLVMAFMVIGLHAGFLAEFSELASFLTVNGVFRIAVPVFLVINGFYFLPVLTKQKFTSWFKRVSILYVFWMFFYAYFWLDISSFSLHTLTKLLITLLIGYHHLWYVSGMIGAALLVFLCRKLTCAVLGMSIVITALTGILIQYLGNYHFYQGSIIDTVFNIDLMHRNAVLFSYPFFCLGYLIHKYNWHKKISLSHAVVISGLGFFMLLIESAVNYYQPAREGGFDNYLSLLIVSPALFILFTKFDIPASNKNFALYSSAIYFIHIYVLKLITIHTDFQPTAATLYCLLLSLIAAYFIIKINKKVKVIL